ncbi:MAG: Bax inhibitor-1/YccA family protein [Hydrotalea sp.]|nr:Bax inhibitor-1/YccA family protein [Hydrotalea sp.]
MSDNFSFSSVASKAKVTYDVGLRRFMLSTYNYMALGIAFTGLVTLFLAVNEPLMRALSFGIMSLVIFGATLAVGLMAPRLILQSRSIATAHLAFWGYAALVSILITPLIYSFLSIEGGALDLARAFFITAGMFAGSSLFGYVTRRNLQGMAHFIFMLSLGVFLAMIVNAFLKSSGFSMLLSFAVVGISAVATAISTQMLKQQYDEFYRAGPQMITRLGILGALMLYGSFINMFINILNIIGLSRRE